MYFFLHIFSITNICIPHEFAEMKKDTSRDEEIATRRSNARFVVPSMDKAVQIAAAATNITGSGAAGSSTADSDAQYAQARKQERRAAAAARAADEVNIATCPRPNIIYAIVVK